MLEHVTERLMVIGSSIVVFAVFWLAASIVGRILGRFTDRADSARRDVIRLGVQTIRGVILVVGLITALGTAGVNVSALVASLGLTGFALGFAFKDALSNILAGAMILFYRPFQRGERIAVTNFEGVVTGVDFRYTTLQGDGKKYLIPNATMLSNVITVSPPPPGP